LFLKSLQEKKFLTRRWPGGVQRVWQLTKYTNKIYISGIYMPRDIKSVNSLQQRIRSQEYSDNLWEAPFKMDPGELL